MACGVLAAPPRPPVLPTVVITRKTLRYTQHVIQPGCRFLQSKRASKRLHRNNEQPKAN